MDCLPYYMFGAIYYLTSGIFSIFRQIPTRTILVECQKVNGIRKISKKSQIFVQFDF